MEYADDSTSGNQCTTGNVERTVGVRSEASRGRGCEKRDGNETGFYLKGYAYRGTIDSERELEEVKSHLFSDVANTVCYYDKTHDAYDVVSVGLMRCLSGVMERPVMIDAIRSDCEKAMHAGMETIELEWCRNGNTYRSWAVAEKGGRIVFENIGCLIADMESMVQCDRDGAESEREKYSRSPAR